MAEKLGFIIEFKVKVLGISEINYKSLVSSCNLRKFLMMNHNFCIIGCELNDYWV